MRTSSTTARRALGRAGRCGIAFCIVALLGAGCFSTDEDFPDDTARVDVGGRSHDLDVQACGRDEARDVFVLAAGSAEAFLQLLLVIDGDEIDHGASAISFETGDVGIVGAGDPDLLGVAPGVPGTIVEAGIRGDRVDVEADVASIGADPVSGLDAPVLDLVARCAAVEEMALAPG